MRGPEHPAVQLSPGPVEGGARAGAAVPRAAMNGRAGPWGPCVGPRSDTCGPCGIHADRRQAVERRGHRGPEAVRDPADDVSGRPPRDVQEAADRLPVRDAHQPCALRLGVAREPAARLGPRHGSDHDAARRRPGHARGTSFRIGSIGAYPHVDAPGSRARVRNAAANP